MTTQQEFLRDAMSSLDLTRDAFADRFGVTRRALDTWLLPTDSSGFRPVPDAVGRYVAEVLWLYAERRLTYTRSVHIIPPYVQQGGAAMQAVLDPGLVSFRGSRTRTETTVELVDDGVPRPLPFHLGVRNHSPMGFEWGYFGSGPAQLALAMCVELVGPIQAQSVYQFVKDALIAPLQTDKWHIQGFEVMEIIWAHTAESAA